MSNSSSGCDIQALKRPNECTQKQKQKQKQEQKQTTIGDGGDYL